MRKKTPDRVRTLLGLVMVGGMAASASAATWYVDSTATGSRNGTSWVNAWTNVNQVKGVGPGDAVYISGGPSGSSQTYTLSNSWTPAGGAAGSPITYQIGQDSAHNGTAVFNSSSDWLGGALNNVVVSGDAGDGNQHFQLNNVTGIPASCNGSSYLRVAYVNCGNRVGGFELNSVSHIEVDHCYLKKVDVGQLDHAMYFGSGDEAWDLTKVHDNTFYVPHDSVIPGDGDDCVQGAADSFSFYNNRVIGYPVTPYQNAQHQDGLQPLAGNYIKVHDNYFQDIGNYGVFGDAYYGDFNHFWVYNNIIVLTDPVVQAGSPAAIAIGPDGGAYNQLGRWPAFTDVIEANNLVADYLTNGSIGLHNNPGQTSTFTNCLVVNNLILNSGGIWDDSTVTTANNVTTSLASGVGHFVSYTPDQGNTADFHLVSGDTLFRNQGLNESAYFTTDKDGNPRPAGGPWDLGPYQYQSSSTSPQPSPTPPAIPQDLRVILP